MLLGVRGAASDELVAAGHRLRVYVPFGPHWYEYSLRRLQENPRIAGYVAAETWPRAATEVVDARYSVVGAECLAHPRCLDDARP